MRGLAAWIVFGLSALACLVWIGGGVRDELREDHVFHHVLEDRLALAAASGGELRIGVAGDFSAHPDILRGAELAAARLNAEGGVLGRKVVLALRDDHGAGEGALEAAQAFALDPAIPFVVGHTSLRLLAGVAQNYAFYGVLALSPNTAGTGYSTGAFPLVFGNAMDPADVGRAALDLALRKGWKRVGLIYGAGDQGARRAREFESLADKRGLRVALSFGFEGRGSGVARHMARWRRELDLDAVFLGVGRADELPLVAACRAVGMGCPFVFLGERPEIAPASRPLYGVLYCPEQDPSEGYAAFAGEYEARFRRPPGRDALLGCDAVLLLGRAASRAGTCVPAKVADALRKGVPGSLSGTLRFDARGCAVKRPPRFVEF
ncbi:ABC transporter substrate-binding protein [Pseudodesulfovibrio sp.]|uniref:ABC transporter substrate-binding protein n=1 Tax=Pseudodesulfovibrio sp. TaxID=2035812 RepID=UPI002626C27E|nr:ABC transporter substrate-binding protein [Pseudodesulfovibrio sp.]MDD3311174.1 ABC transporter substrate-binding protein [Pseudodesulfovibrio sp.]